jgi:hypothetical protein
MTESQELAQLEEVITALEGKVRRNLGKEEETESASAAEPESVPVKIVEKPKRAKRHKKEAEGTITPAPVELSKVEKAQVLYGAAKLKAKLWKRN